MVARATEKVAATGAEGMREGRARARSRSSARLADAREADRLAPLRRLLLELRGLQLRRGPSRHRRRRSGAPPRARRAARSSSSSARSVPGEVVTLSRAARPEAPSGVSRAGRRPCTGRRPRVHGDVPVAAARSRARSPRGSRFARTRRDRRLRPPELGRARGSRTRPRLLSVLERLDRARGRAARPPRRPRPRGPRADGSAARERRTRRARFGEAYARAPRDGGRGAAGARRSFSRSRTSDRGSAREAVGSSRADVRRLRRARSSSRSSGRCGPPLRILDLGAGNGWLAARLTRRGHVAVALDLRTDCRRRPRRRRPRSREALPRMFPRVAASFDAVPFRGRLFDLVLFDASLHYARGAAPRHSRRPSARRSSGRARGDPRLPLLPPRRVRRDDGGGEEARDAPAHGDLADALLARPGDRVPDRSTPARGGGEPARPLLPAAPGRLPRSGTRRGPALAISCARQRRPPSRFDVWEAAVP